MMRGIRLSLALGCLLLTLIVPEAWADTLIVTFDDLDGGETVTDQYIDTHGVSFSGPGSGDGAYPIVRTVGSDIAHSGGQVADISFCLGCEFYTPRTVGRLTSTATQVSMFVGYIGSDVGNAPADVRLTARDAFGETVGTSSTTVVQGQPFGQMLSVTSPGGPDIASFELVAEPPSSSQTIGFDDLTLQYPDVGPPADFALRVPDGPAQQGSFVDRSHRVRQAEWIGRPGIAERFGLTAGDERYVPPQPGPGSRHSRDHAALRRADRGHDELHRHHDHRSTGGRRRVHAADHDDGSPDRRKLLGF